jgi:hypothetical protein
MAPTWGHVLIVECMRTKTSPGRPVPTLNKTNCKIVGWFYHPSSIYIKTKNETDLKNKILAFFSKFSKLSMKSI